MRSKFKWIFTLILALSIQASFAQEKNITGIVSDELGPIAGANVVVKGTTNGTTTDFDGKYTISAKTGDILFFTYVGKKEKEITVGSSNNYDITLQDGVNLQEVVVTGALGIKRKPDELTTSSQVVKAEELNQANNPNAVQALAGKVSGLQINTTSTGLNPDTQIILRGVKSVSGRNEALVVIDNVISSAGILQSLDPSIIESVNILKGANGAALYGELGGNGVVIVTTKKGNKSDKLNVNLSSSVTFEEIAFVPQGQNRYGQGWQGDFDWTDQGSWGPEYDGSMQVTGTPDPYTGEWRFSKYEHIKDHIKPYFNTGILSQNTVSLAAGNINDGYVNLSLNLQDTKGVIPDDVRTKNFLNISTGKKFGKFNVSTIARYSYEKTNRTNSGTYAALNNTPSNIPVGMYDSGIFYDHWTLYDTSPYWTRKNNRVDSRSTFFEMLGEVTYNVNKNINILARGSVQQTKGRGVSFVNEYIDLKNFFGADDSVVSAYSKSLNESSRFYTDFMANFDYDLTDAINFKANAGFNLRGFQSDFVSIGGTNLALDNFYDISNVGSIPTADEGKTITRNAAVFANIDLGYKDYLFLNFTARNDWSSVLPNNNASFFYPSAGIAFIPTKAYPSLKGNILHKMKVSASYVRTGNTGAIAAHEVPYVGNVAPGYPYQLSNFNSFLLESDYTDPNIKNEFVNSAEFNMNFEFLNRRVPRITLDMAASFIRNTDMLLNITTSSATNYGSSLINIGETKTNAYEIDLGFTPIKTDNFSWTNTLSYSAYKTTVEKVTDESDRVQASSGLYAVEGQQFPLIVGTAYSRDDQGRIIIDADGNPIESSDLKILGKTTPDYIINFSTQFRYKNVRLAAVMDYRTGHQFYSGVAAQMASQGRTIETAENGREPFIYPNSVVQGQTETNTTVYTGGTGSYAGYQAYITDNYSTFNENFVYDATAFKLREVSLSYDFSKNLISRLKLDGLSVGVSGRNLLTVLPKENRGYNDPETGSGIAGYSFTPPTRFYSFNVNLKF